MTLSELNRALQSTGLPVTYRAWPEDSAPPLPFICYLSTGTNTLPADGSVYYQWDDIRVELYTKWKDTEAEAKVEAALNDLHWTKTGTYVESERCYIITYEIEV